MSGYNQPAQFSVRQLHELIILMFVVRGGIKFHNDKLRLGMIVH